MTVYGAPDAPSVGVVSFNIAGMDNGYVADLLSGEKIAVRGGLHCAPAMHAYLGTDGAVRASVGPYNTEREMDAFLAAVEKIAAKG